MNNYMTMNIETNRQINMRASVYTAAIAGALLLLIFFVRFYQPVQAAQPQEEYIEINLGSSDVGSGDDQPELPGEPAPEQQVAYTPVQHQSSSNEAARDIEESNDVEAAPVYKPKVTRTDARKINAETEAVKKTTTTTNNTPAQTQNQPRAVMGQVRGGNGNGGNGAATYKPGTGEGRGGGTGDEGSIGGNPNGKNYSPRQLGAKVVSMPSRTFEDDFKESGKIVLDIHVDENGRLLSASFQPKGSTISNRNQIEIAKRRARELSYPKYPGGFKQPHVFVFDVKN